MHRNKAAILTLAGSIVFASSSGNATDLDKVNSWITSNHPWKACHPPSLVQNPANPGFAFGGGAALNMGTPHGVCLQSGPFQTKHPKNVRSAGWWVQVISNLRPSGCTNNSCLVDLVRVCSLDYVLNPVPNPVPFRAGVVCASAKGIGPAGCEVCAVPSP